MRKVKDGVCFASIELPFNTTNQFRYLIDENSWENDAAADDYVPSQFGSDNSVVIIGSK